ncbi:MAG: hypothetical protein ABJN98_09465 [Roseibium sp.]
MVSINASIENVDPNKARDLALDLETHIKRELSRNDLEAQNMEFNRADKNAQDLGTILSIVLAGPAVVVLANAIRDWVKFNSGTDLDINGVIINNLNSEDVSKVIEAINAG